MRTPRGCLQTRVALRDEEVGGFLIPAGTRCMFIAWALHHDAAHFPEPQEFR